MSFIIMVLIMLFAGSLGGIVNYYLPANNPETGKYLKPVKSCIILGIGATLLVPLFLEIAQSKLMESIRFDQHWTAVVTDSTVLTKDTVKIVTQLDSAKKTIKADTTNVKARAEKKEAVNTPDTGKNYFLWAAYCLLAAAAGFKFINMLIKNVVKEGEVDALKTENKSLVTEKKLEEKKNQLYAEKEEKKAVAKLMSVRAVDQKDLPAIGPITVSDDPQKGRFGGKAKNNFRELKAAVTTSNVPSFYNVKIWVESTDETQHPLQADCVFYIHDSFRPSVYTIKPDKGIAMDDEILSYGAFTVGVVTDDGATLLELDLAQNKDFPKEFRQR